MPAPLVHASVIRATVVGVWIVLAFRTPIASYSALGASNLLPIGLGGLFLQHPAVAGTLTNEWALLTLKGSIAAIGSWLLFRRGGHRSGHLILLVLCVVLDALQKSLGGVVHHAQILPLIALAVIACGPGVPYVCLADLCRLAREPRMAENPREPVAANQSKEFVQLIALCAVVPYTLIAMQRLATGGMTLFTGDYLLWILASSSNGFEAYPVAMSANTMRAPLNFGFLATTVFELLSLFAMKFRAFGILWLAVVGGFHLATLLFMNVFFVENLAILIPLFLGRTLYDRPLQ